MGGKKFLGAVTSIVACMSFFIAMIGAVQAQTYLIKYGTIGPLENQDTQGGLLFKDFVETQSKGKIKVEVYPSAQLGTFREQLEAVGIGTQEFTVTSLAGPSSMLPEIQVTDIPYMFPDDRVAEKVYDGWFTEKLREAMWKKVPNARLMLVSMGGGSRTFATKIKQIRTPGDLKGVKMRTIESELHVQFMKAMGASPTPVPWQETYTSLKTGVVDGINNGVKDIVDMKFQEVLKHLTLDNHMYLATFYWINNKVYMSLPNDLKKIVLDALYHVKWFTRNQPKRAAIDAYEIFKKAGGTVYVPTFEEKAQFIEASKPVRQWFIDKYGRDWVDLLEKAVAEAKAEIDKENVKEM